MPFNLPIVNCGSNSALDSLKNKVGAIKDAVNGSLEGLQNDLADSLSSIKDGLKGLAPESPALRDFKADLMSLVGKTGLALEKAKSNLNDLWGGAVSDLESLMDAISNPLSGFNICKDAPAVKATTNADGTLSPVVEAQESPTPAENPAKAILVSETVQRKSESPSTTDSGVSHSKATADYKAYENVRVAAYEKLVTDLERLNVETARLANLPSVKKARGINESALSRYDLNARDRLRKGVITQSEFNDHELWLKTDLERSGVRGALLAVYLSFDNWEAYYFGLGGQNKQQLQAADKGYRATHFPYASYFSKPEEITTANEPVLRAYGKTFKN